MTPEQKQKIHTILKSKSKGMYENALSQVPEDVKLDIDAHFAFVNGMTEKIEELKGHKSDYYRGVRDGYKSALDFYYKSNTSVNYDDNTCCSKLPPITVITVPKFTCKHCGEHEKEWSRKNDDWYCKTCGHIINP